MIARVLIFIFLGIVLIQAKSLNGKTKTTSVARIQKLMAKAAKVLDERNHAIHATLNPQSNDSVTQPPLTDAERDALMKAYIKLTAEKFSKLVQDVALLTKSLITSSTKMVLAVLKSTSKIISDDAKKLQPLMKNITEELRAIKPPSQTYLVIRRKNPVGPQSQPNNQSGGPAL